jgi:hypothetical protein
MVDGSMIVRNSQYCRAARVDAPRNDVWPAFGCCEGRIRAVAFALPPYSVRQDFHRRFGEPA